MAGLPTYDRRTLLENTGVVRMPGGEGLFDLATVAARGARIAGAEAERRDIAAAGVEGDNVAVTDAEGNLSFQPRLGGTEADEAYNKAAGIHYRAALALKSYEAALKYRGEAKDDPAAFEALWKGHTEGTLQQVPPIFRGDATQILAERGSQTFGGLLLQARATELKNAADALNLQLAQVGADYSNLAFTGAAGSDLAQRKAQEYDKLLRQAVDAKLMNADEAALRRNAMLDDGRALAVAHSAVQVFKSKGEEAANKYLRDTVSDPNLHIPEARRERIINMAQAQFSELNGGRIKQLSDLKFTAKDSLDRSKLGYEVPTGTYSAYAARARALGDEHFADEMEQTELVSGAVQSAAALPVAAIQARAAEAADLARDPRTGGTGALIADALGDLARVKTAAMQHDPWGYASRVHKDVVGKVEAIDFTKPTEAAALLNIRTSQADHLAAIERVPNMLPLSKAEIDGLTGLIPKMTIDQKTALVKTLGDGLGSKYLGPVMAEIAKGPGTLEFTTAAGIATQDPATARRILQGEQVMRTTKDALPEANAQLRTQIDDRLHDAFAMLPGAREAAVQSALAIYAADSDAKGDHSKKLDTDRMANALDAVTGGILNRNGGYLVAPKRGMKQSEFDALMSGLQESDLGPPPVKSDGSPARLTDIRDHGVLRSIGDGRYLVTVSGFALKRADGQPWELDLRQTPVRVPPRIRIPELEGAP